LRRQRSPRPWPRLALLVRLHGATKRKTSCLMGNSASVYTAAVITVSDSCSRGEREDLSGPAVAKALEEIHFSIHALEVIPDDKIKIQNLLISLSREVQLVVTTGGTGIAARDVTPEATIAVCERLLDGVSERMRSEGSKKTPFAALSRAACGARGK